MQCAFGWIGCTNLEESGLQFVLDLVYVRALLSGLGYFIRFAQHAVSSNSGKCYPLGFNCSGQLQLATPFQPHWQAHAEAAATSEAAASARHA